MDTFGWDTAFVADLDCINQSLAAAMSSLVAEFDFSEQDYEVKGTFGPWSIVPGGAGKLLWMRLPIASGTVSSPGHPPVDVSGLAVTLQISLEMLPSPGGAGGQTLHFNFKSVGGPATGDGAVTPVGVDDPARRLGPIQQMALSMAVAQCMVRNAGSISYVFATINPLAVEATPWLKPVQCDYCYGALTGTTAPVLAILSANDGRDISGLPRKVDPSIIAAGSRLALAISPSLVLLHIIAPRFAAGFGVSEGAFHLSDPTTLSADMFTLTKVQSPGGSPCVNSFSVAVEDTRMAVSLAGICSMGTDAFNMTSDITLHFATQFILGAKFDTSALSYCFPQIGTPTFSHHLDIPWYEWLSCHVGDILQSIFDIIPGISTHDESTPLTDSIQANVAPPLGVAAAGIVNWSGSSGFHANGGGLAGALFLRGNPL